MNFPGTQIYILQNVALLKAEFVLSLLTFCGMQNQTLFPFTDFNFILWPTKYCLEWE